MFCFFRLQIAITSIISRKFPDTLNIVDHLDSIRIFFLDMDYPLIYQGDAESTLSPVDS